MKTAINQKSQLTNLQSAARQLRKPQGTLGKQVGLMMNKGNELMNLAAIDQLNVQPHDRILEIGMGNGFFIREIVSKNETVRYCGCDFSQTMVEEALLFNEEYVNNGQVCFVKADATRLPFRDETFDKLFTVNTIYFWKDVEIFISEIRRVLTKNGLFLLSLRPRSVMDKLPIIQYGFQTFSKSDCIRILRNNGFKIISSNEYEDDDLELGATKYKNAFMIIKATKN